MKTVLISIASVLGLGFLAIVVILALLENPEVYQSELSDQLKRRTGFGLRIGGDITWQYFPTLRLVISDVSVTTPTDDELAHVETFAAEVALMPLLSANPQLHIDGIELSGLRLKLKVDRAGNKNWEVAAAGVSHAPADTSIESDDAESPVSTSTVQYVISTLRIRNGEFDYEDLESTVHYKVQLAELRSSNLTIGHAFPVSARFEISDLARAVHIKGKGRWDVDLNESFDHFKIAADLELSVEGLAPVPVPISLRSNIDFDVNLSMLSLQQTSIETPNLAASLSLSGNVTKLDLTGTISADRINPNGLLSEWGLAPVEVANETRMSQASFTGEFNLSETSAGLRNITARLDESSITGDLALTNLASMAVRFDLEVDQLNLDSYGAAARPDASAPETKAKPKTAPSELADVTDPEVIPTDLIRSLDLDGQLKIGHLQYAGVVTENLSLTIKANGGELMITSKGNIFAGEVSSNIHIIAGDKTNGDVTIKGSGIDVQQLFDNQMITGQLQLEAKHTFSGSLQSDLTGSIDGDTTFTISDGTLDIVAIKSAVRLIESLQKSTSRVADWPDKLVFTTLNGTMSINNGISADHRLALTLDNISMTGLGGYDYRAERLDYDFHIVFTEPGGLLTVNPRIIGIEWPIHCEGKVDDDPQALCGPDRSGIERLVASIATQEIKKKARELVSEKLGKNLPEEVKSAAEKLFKRLFDR